MECFITVLLRQGHGYFPPEFTDISKPAASPVSMSSLILEHLASRSIKFNALSSLVVFVGGIKVVLPYPGAIFAILVLGVGDKN